MGTVFVIALRNLAQGGRRTLLLGLALALVTLLLVLLDALAAGLETSMLRSATTLSSGHVNVGGFFKVSSGQASPTVAEGARVRQIIEREVEGQDYVIDRLRGWARAVSETGSSWFALAGVDIREERGLKEVLQIIEGRIEDLEQPNTVMLFEAQAKRLESKIGDSITLSAPTMGGVNNTVDVRVVAIASDVGWMSAISLFMPKDTVRNLYQMRPEATGAVQIYLKDPERGAEVIEKLKPVLETEGFRLMESDPRPFWMKFETVAGQDWVNQKLDLTTWKEEVSFLLWILTGFNALRWSLLGVLLVVIVVGIMNAMFMSIRERTREIGTMRAIGMSRGAVQRMFLVEASSLGVIAAFIGAACGVGTVLLVNAAHIKIPNEAFQAILMSDVLLLALKPMNVVVAILVITVVTCIAAFAPARRAARLRPIGALHQVG
jgi:ABC-type lipoprotein release transport system permease subunit